jgi:hypothetical protein
MNPRVGDEGTATFSQRRVAQFFDAVQCGEIGLEVALEIALRVGHCVAFGEIKSGAGYSRDHEHHRKEKL